VLYSLPTKTSMATQIGGSSEGEKGVSSLTLSKNVEMELWTSIENSIKSMIEETAKLSLDQANGTISLTATPGDIKKVARYINEQNVRLSRQVAISVKVLLLTLDDIDQYGLNFSALFNDKDGRLRSLGITSAPGFPQTDIANNLSMNLMPGNWNINAAIQALSKKGDVSLVTSGTVTTQNNKPAPIQVVQTQKYISEYTTTTSGTDGNTRDDSVTTDDLETGFVMNVLPRIIEHGRLMLMFNLSLSDLVSLEKVDIGDKGAYIQNPIVQARGFTQEVAMKSGESLILAGYEAVSTETKKSGVGSATNSLLGGTAEASRNRAVLVIILTPVVMDSPLVPESRMKDI
jgi:type IVB pilus formation R64 PilN family outer membrane protein